MNFEVAVVPERLLLTFQGGFVGTRCSLEIRDDSSGGEGKPQWRAWTTMFPEDVNRKQIFELPSESLQGGVDGLKLVFEESSDFFGRITVYDLQLLGKLF